MNHLEDKFTALKNNDGIRPHYFKFSMIIGIIGLIHIIVLNIGGDYVFHPLAGLIATIVFILLFFGCLFGYLDYKIQRKSRSWISILLCGLGLLYTIFYFIIASQIGTSGI